ncbi:hypothetical protein HOY82DRAFT_538029 [Tuber indicum]|nr:hypothetical protein HOY82DRAFT_538029 [Tuber indicum]
MCDPGPNSGLYWIGDPPGARLPPVVHPRRAFTEQGAQPTGPEFTEVSAFNLLFGGMKFVLLMHFLIYLLAAIGIIPALMLFWIFGPAMVLISEEICDLDKARTANMKIPNRPSTQAIRRILLRHPWVSRLVDSLNRIRLPPFAGRLLEYVQASRICSGTIFTDSELMNALAVATLANTASMIISFDTMSGIQGWLGLGLFSLQRNLELPLSWFRGQMRGTLRASSAMASHSVYEDLFVSGICFPQLANPPICKLHYT